MHRYLEKSFPFLYRSASQSPRLLVYLLKTEINYSIGSEFYNLTCWLQCRLTYVQYIRNKSVLTLLTRAVLLLALYIPRVLPSITPKVRAVITDVCRALPYLPKRIVGYIHKYTTVTYMCILSTSLNRYHLTHVRSWTVTSIIDIVTNFSKNCKKITHFWQQKPCEDWHLLRLIVADYYSW
jgi:hypothetical protein